MKRKYPPRVDASAEDMAQAMFALPADHKWEYEESEPDYSCSDCGKVVRYPNTLYQGGRCGRAIASKFPDMVQLRSTIVATVTGMGWIVSRTRSRLRIPENTAFQRCFVPDCDHVFRSVGFRCDCPGRCGPCHSAVSV